MSDELKKWQKLQSRNILNEKASAMSRPSFFNRTHRLDLSRDRLTSSLFLRVPLYNKEGRNALRDMIILYKENPKVAYCLSL